MENRCKPEDRRMKPAVRSIEERNVLAVQHWGLVLAMAKKFRLRVRGSGLELDDIIQEGWLGLLRAADLYEETRGKFSVYAHWHIERRMIRMLCLKLIRVPDSFSGSALTKEQQQQKRKQVREMNRCITRLHSKEGETIDVPDRSGDRDCEERLDLKEALRRMHPRQKLVIQLRLAGCSQAKISEQTGIPRTLVSQAWLRAVRRLREILNPRPRKAAA